VTKTMKFHIIVSNEYISAALPV